MNKKTTLVQLLVVVIITLCTTSCGDDPCEATNPNFADVTIDGKPFVPTLTKATRTVSGMEIKFKNEELEINIRTRKPTGTFNVAIPHSDNTDEDAWVELIKKTGAYEFAESGTLNISGCNTLTSGSFNLSFGDLNFNGVFEDFHTDDLSSYKNLNTTVTFQNLNCPTDDCTPSVRKFEYDRKGRVAAIFVGDADLFIYSADKLIGAETTRRFTTYSFWYEDAQIKQIQNRTHHGSATYTYLRNAQQTIIGYDYFYSWKGSFPSSCKVTTEMEGNNYSSIIYKCSDYSTGDSNSVVTIEQYDNKKNVGLSMRKAFIDDPVFLSYFLNIHGKIPDLSENNPIRIGDNLYTYEYNDRDFPTSIVRTFNGNSQSITTIEYSN